MEEVGFTSQPRPEPPSPKKCEGFSRSKVLGVLIIAGPFEPRKVISQPGQRKHRTSLRMEQTYVSNEELLCRRSEKKQAGV